MATADPVAPPAGHSFAVPVTYYDMFFGEWDQEKTRHFMENTNIYYSVIVTILYLIMVRYGPELMKNRKAWDLRSALAVWNFALSAYSGISLIILWPHFVKSYNKGGIIGTICYNDDLYTNAESGWWGWLYCMSKGPELIDTVFLILRKRPIILLHWYHHSVTFIGGQYFYTEFVPWARPGVITNLFVHTVMYAYYGVRAAGIKTERWVSKMVTRIQITQFLSGFIYGFHLLYAYVNDDLEDCVTKPDKMVIGSIVVGSYLYLFTQYFRDAYTLKERGGATPVKKIEESPEAEEIKKDQ